jgi:DNA-binding MarR family transcriptional regulator
MGFNAPRCWSDPSAAAAAHAENHDDEGCNPTREAMTLTRPRSKRRQVAGAQGQKASASRRAARPPVAAADEPIALGDLSGNLGYRLRRAQLWVFKDISRRLARYELSPAQFSVLAVVAANPGINQLTIASALDIERAGLGRLVDRLAQQGLVTRIASVVHRRYYALHVTTAGTKLLDQVRPVIAQGEKDQADRLGATTHKSVLQALSIFLKD